jgi:hypothetical protein
VHILMIADSDNARQQVPIDEIVSEQRIVVLPPNLGNVGETYGRSFEKQLVPVAAPYAAGTGTGAEEPPAGSPAPTGDSTGGDTTGGGTTTDGGSGTGGNSATDSSGQPASYPGETAQAAPAPANTKPEATEQSVLGVRASASCLPAPQKVSSRGIGRFRLGQRVDATLMRDGRRVGHAKRYEWCVSGGGKLIAIFTTKNRVQLVAIRRGSNGKLTYRVDRKLRKAAVKKLLRSL